MKVTIDTDLITKRIKANAEELRRNFERTTEKVNKSAYESLQDETEFIKLMVSWNEKRLSEGKDIFMPDKLSRTAQRALRDELKQLDKSFDMN